MSDRTIIVVTNNPLSASPRAALLPYPARSAGWNLWRMTYDVCGVSRCEFRRSFEFVNLCDDMVWNPLAARAKYDALESAWAGRRVLLLGRAVLGVLWLAAPPYDLLWRAGRPYLWCALPHPSGMCHEYNDSTVRLAVGLRLEEEMHRGNGASVCSCARVGHAQK